MDQSTTQPSPLQAFLGKGSSTSQGTSVAAPASPRVNGLSQSLNDQQIRENIDSLISQNAPHDTIQSYIDNYQGDGKGGYVLKGSQASSQNNFSDASSTSGSFNQNSKKTFLDKVAGIIPGIKTLEGIGTVIANTGIVGKSPQDMAIESLNQSGDIQKKLADQIVSDKAEGKDTTRLEKALHALQNDAQAEGGQISNLGTQGETNNQAIGDAVSLAGTVAGGAELAGAGEAAASTAAEGLKAGAISGAAAGTVAGAGSGVGNAISNNESAGNVIKSGIGGAASGFAGGAVLGGALGTVAGALAKPEFNAITQRATDLQNIKNIIEPEATKAESQLAMQQGRVYPGKPATLFKPATPDVIAASENTAKQIFAIEKNIPDAGKMDPSTLSDALDNKVTDITKQLRPQLDSTPIAPENISKINSEWQQLQKTQISDAPADQEANVAKRQLKFDAFLQKTTKGDVSDVVAEARKSDMDPVILRSKIEDASKPPTLGDLWDTAIKYDNSIPDSVKSANKSLAPSESLLQQRTEWLQNRAILKKAIINEVPSLEEKSRQAFSDMSDMLDAKSQITKNTTALNNQKLPKSKIYQAINSPKGKAIQTAAKLLGGGYILDKGVKATTGLGF